MKFNACLLSTFLLFVAVLFPSCTKETRSGTSPAQTNKEAVSRGECKVFIEANGGALDICGTQNSVTVCGAAGGINLFGDGFIPDGGSDAYYIVTPASLLISRNPNIPPSSLTVTATVSTDGGTVVYPVPANGSVQVDVDDFCNQ